MLTQGHLVGLELLLQALLDFGSGIADSLKGKAATAFEGEILFVRFHY